MAKISKTTKKGNPDAIGGYSYVKKNNETHPNKAGSHNLTEERIKRDKVKTADQEEASQLMRSLTELFMTSTDPVRKTKSSAWTADDVRREVGKYFMYCEENNLKPTKSGLSMWLCISKETYHDWYSNRARDPEKSDVLLQANFLMENQYVNRGEKHPAFNTFMLKAQCGYVEKQEVVVENKNASEEDVQEAIKKLGIK